MKGEAGKIDKQMFYKLEGERFKRILDYKEGKGKIILKRRSSKEKVEWGDFRIKIMEVEVRRLSLEDV